MSYPTIGQAFRHLRLELGLTVNRMAEELCMDPERVNEIEASNIKVTLDSLANWQAFNDEVHERFGVDLFMLATILGNPSEGTPAGLVDVCKALHESWTPRIYEAIERARNQIAA